MFIEIAGVNIYKATMISTTYEAYNIIVSKTYLANC